MNTLTEAQLKEIEEIEERDAATRGASSGAPKEFTARAYREMRGGAAEPIQIGEQTFTVARILLDWHEEASSILNESVPLQLLVAREKRFDPETGGYNMAAAAAAMSGRFTDTRSGDMVTYTPEEFAEQLRELLFALPKAEARHFHAFAALCLRRHHPDITADDMAKLLDAQDMLAIVRVFVRLNPDYVDRF